MPLSYNLHNENRLERIWRWWLEVFRLSMLSLQGAREIRVGRHYDEVVGVGNTVGESSLFINMGYWKGRPETLDAASAELARLVANEADISCGDVVIDVGPGFGDQDFLWVDEFEPLRITGVNISKKQIDIASARARALNLSAKIQYVYGSASNLPLPDESAQKVVALESAVHFPSHSEFFTNAFRVLRPNGKLVTADVISLPRSDLASKRAIVARWLYARHRDTNKIEAPEYSEALSKAGFVNVKIRSIRSDVFEPYADYLRKRFNDPEAPRVNPLLKILYGPRAFKFIGLCLDYVIVRAEKPIEPMSSQC